MKKISLRISVFVLLATVLFTSCSKEGPAGPAGATGATGAAGPAGAAGAAGPAGAAGTANVIYSAWLDAAYLPDTQKRGNIIDTLGWYVDFATPRLTAAVLGNSEIKVYLNLNTAAAPTVVPLPYIEGDLLISPYFFVGGIELYCNYNVSTRTTNGVKTLQVRYIIIPGGVPARSSIDYNKYEEVKAYYNIPD